MADLLVASRVAAAREWSIVAAGSAGVAFRSTSDECLVGPNGECLPMARFGNANALLGIGRPVGRIHARVLVGPSLHRGAGDTSVGLQGRLDLGAPVSRTIAVGVMLRATRLSSHGGQVSFPGGRIEAGETPEAAAVYEG